MTKREIVQAIAKRFGITQLQAKQIVQKTFDSIVDTLAADGRVELRNFGVFEVKRRKSRTARNPYTGGTIMVPEKFRIAFKPGQLVEERVASECRTAASGFGSGLPESSRLMERSENP